VLFHAESPAHACELLHAEAASEGPEELLDEEPEGA